MPKKKKINRANMQKPYKRINSKGGRLRLYPWQEILMSNFKAEINKDNPSIDKNDSTINDYDHYVVTKESLDNLWASIPSKYSGVAKLFIDESLVMSSSFGHGVIDKSDGFINRPDVVPIKFSSEYGLVKLEQDYVAKLSSVLGVPSNLINNETIDNTKDGIEDDNSGPYIENDIEWFNKYHTEEYLHITSSEEYVDVKIEPEYAGLRKIWNPDEALLLDRSTDYMEIDAYLYPNSRIIQIIGSIEDEKINKILNDVRSLLYHTGNHIFNNLNLNNLISISFFNEYNRLVRKLSLLLDKEGMIDYHSASNPKLGKRLSFSLLSKYEKIADKLSKDLDDNDLLEYEDVDNSLYSLFFNEKFQHSEIYEKLFGIILATRNICVIQKKDEHFTSILDFDFMNYSNSIYGKASVKNYISSIETNPSNFFEDIIFELIVKIKNIISSLNGIFIKDISIVNYKEWIIDIIRYFSELNQYETTKDAEILPIFQPIPVRIILDFGFVKRDLNKDLDTDNWKMVEVIENSMPADILDLLAITNGSMAEYYNRLLWEGFAEINTVRNSSFRDELAPQLWDCAYYISVLEPQWDREKGFKPNKLNLSIKYRTDILKIYFNIFHSVLLSGQCRYREILGIARKENFEDMARLGWYAGFLKVID